MRHSDAMKSYFAWTIGCQMNFSDSSQAAASLESLGLAPAPRAEDADLIVLNTCVVRQRAEDKAAGRISSLKSVKRRKPQTAIVVMGCLVHEDVPALQAQFPHVDLFLRPSDVRGLTEFAENWLSVGAQPSRAELAHAPLLEQTLERATAPVSAYVPIMHGCDHHCSYCIVTLRRGPGRSSSVQEVVAEANRIVSAGAKEITLLGQNIDTYGRDLPERPDLADLLEAVHEIQGLRRIRFLTSHPADMADKLIATIAQLPKVCEHFELPVQAGDDLVLRRMGRGYTAQAYRELIGRIREAMPPASIATDVIVGFPGETEAQFQRTLDLVADLRFDAVHIAAYSPRPGTPAARLPDDVPAEEKARRRQAVEQMQEAIAAEINAPLLGASVEILVEERRKGKWKGRTRSNKLVFFSSPGDWRGKLAQVRITWTGPWSLQGSRAESATS